MEPLNVIIDTREQMPWSFPEDKVRAVRGTLSTGDYALEGDDKFAVERKSLDDFLGSISSDWDRFLKEIERMEQWFARAIVVEGDYSECCFRIDREGRPVAPDHNHPLLGPAFVTGRIATLVMCHRVSVLFAGNHEQAAAVGYYLLKRRWEQWTLKQS